MLDFSVTFIITIINIAILFFILRAILFKPVTKFMAARAQKVQNAIDEAEKNRSDAQKLLAEYRVQKANAQAEADEIIKAARITAKAEADRIIAEGKADAEAFTAAARRHFEAERQAMINSFKLEAAALVMAASARLVQRELSGEDNRRYANMLLDELSAQKKGNT
jgi:F-type H+-transporting ATPase subunit b